LGLDAMYIFRNRNIENALMVVCPPAGCGIITSGRKHHHFCIKNGANLQRKTACGAASGCKAAADREHIRGRGFVRPPFAYQDTHPGTGEGCKIFLSTGAREVFSAIRKNRKTLRKTEEKTARILPELRQLHAQAHPGAHRRASARVSLQTPPRVKKFSTPCAAP